jgi:hypothetical protein
MNDSRSTYILAADPHEVKGRLMRNVLVTDPAGYMSVAVEVPYAFAMDVLDALRREYQRGREDNALMRAQGEDGTGMVQRPPDRMGVSWGTIPDGAIVASSITAEQISPGGDVRLFPPSACGHVCVIGDVSYACEREPHLTGGYSTGADHGPQFFHAAAIDAAMAKGTDEEDGFGEATLVTWGEDSAGDAQGWSLAWGTLESATEAGS